MSQRRIRVEDLREFKRHDLLDLIEGDDFEAILEVLEAAFEVCRLTPQLAASGELVAADLRLLRAIARFDFDAPA